MAERGIAQRTLGDVSYSGSGGVGDCPRLIPTLGDPWKTAGPRIDRIPLMRPPWWRRRYRELKKLVFSAPSKCPIALFGPLANRTVLKRLHAVPSFASVLHDARNVLGRPARFASGLLRTARFWLKAGQEQCSVGYTPRLREETVVSFAPRAAQPLQAHSKKNAASR